MKVLFSYISQFFSKKILILSEFIGAFFYSKFKKNFLILNTNNKGYFFIMMKYSDEIVGSSVFDLVHRLVVGFQLLCILVSKKKTEASYISLKEIILYRLFLFQKENERVKEMAASKMTGHSGTMEENRRIIDLTLKCQTK